MSRYNRLTRPIAVIASRERFRHLCDVLEVDPHKNDIVVHVHDPESALKQGEFSRVIELGAAKDVTRDYNAVKSLAMSMIRNDATATKFDPRGA